MKPRRTPLELLDPGSSAAPSDARTRLLAQRIDAALPQTQCTRCGYPNCAGYAHAIAAGEAPINQCPPGGAQGIARLAAITGQPITALNPAHGIEAPRTVAWIDEASCIGCTLCIQACPTDAIVGCAKQMHTVIEARCTGCELCIPACPVDCIVLDNASGERTGWDAWSPRQAEQARAHYAGRSQRLARESMHVRDGPEQNEKDEAVSTNRKRAVIEAALARAREQQQRRHSDAAHPAR